MLEIIPGAIVGSENDDRILAQSQFVDGIQQSTGVVVEFFDGVAVQSALGFAFEFWGCVDDRVNHRVGQIQKERFLLILFEKLDSLVGVELGQAGHVPGFPHRLVVVMKPDTAVVIGPERSPIIIEPLSVGHAIDDSRSIGDIPLADATRRVTDGLEQFGESYFACRHAPTVTANRIPSREQRRSGWPTNDLGIETGKACALPS